MEDVTIKQLSHADAATKKNLEQLLSELSSGVVVDQQLLQTIVASESAAILVAVDSDGRYVGTATLNLIQKVMSTKVYLEEFVVAADQRGKGIAQLLWAAIEQWAREHGATKLEFTSNPKKEAAQKFYAKMGATVRETNNFSLEINL